MMDHLIGKNPDLWGVILDGPTIPMKTATDGITKIPKEEKNGRLKTSLQFKTMPKPRKF